MIWIFWLLPALSVCLAYNVYRPIYRYPHGASVSWVFGLLAGELAPHFIAVQMLAVVLFAAFSDALSGAAGALGLALLFAAWAAMALHYARALQLPAQLHSCLQTAGLGNYQPRPQPIDMATLIDPITTMKSASSHNAAVECLKNIVYHRGEVLNLKLDIRRPAAIEAPCPVLLQIHGGAWTYKLGSKERQALPLMNRLAARGWVCVAISYRLSPLATFPDHIIDCKRALAWIKANIADYGGDPDFVAVTGGSAGGHLSALLALTPNCAPWQPGFEQADTRVQACIPFYGIYDFCNRNGQQRHNGLETWLERLVIKAPAQQAPEIYRAASPIHHVHQQAPPFFVIQGDTDNLVPVAESRHFVEALKSHSEQPVAYAEIAGAQHAFDLFASLRTQAVIHAVEAFADCIHADYRRRHQR